MMGKKSATSRGTMGLASCTWSVFWRGSVTFLRILFILWILKVITGTLSRTYNDFWFCLFCRKGKSRTGKVCCYSALTNCRCTHPPTPQTIFEIQGFGKPSSHECWVECGRCWLLGSWHLPRTAPDATLMCHVGRRIEKTQYHVKRQYSYDNTLQIQPCVSVGCVTNSWADL